MSAKPTVEIPSRSLRGVQAMAMFVGMASLLNSGCSSFEWARTSASSIGIAKPAHPTRILAMLSPAQLKNNGQIPQQGMMCRLYFFESNSPLPIQVNGDLTITAYDQSRTDRNRPADGKYDIPAAKLASHWRKDMVGDSYLFWLPYNPAVKTQMSVQAKFTGKDGCDVVSEVVNLELEPPEIAGLAPPALGSNVRRPSNEVSSVRSGQSNNSKANTLGTERLAKLASPVAAN